MNISCYMKIFPWEEDPDYLLCYSTKTAAMILLEKSVLSSVKKEICSDSDRKSLTQLGFLVPSLKEEQKEIEAFFDTMNKNVSKAHIIVVMNLDCNLACYYCYEGKMKGNFYMRPETADQIILFIKRRYIEKGKDIHIDFYGGEPLLSFDLILYLSHELMIAATGKGVGYSSTILTNGTLLTEDRVRKLSELGLKEAHVTIDGIREQHNQSRPFKSGAGSFDRIISNLQKSSHYIKIQLVSNYTKENYQSVPLILDYLCDHAITKNHISIARFVPVAKTGVTSGLPDSMQGCASMNEPWIFTASVYLREEIMKRGFYTPKINPAFCMLESKEDIVINYEGRLYKCPGFLGMKKFNVGDINEGERDCRASHHLDVWKRNECFECSYLPLCFGGCRHASLINFGRIEAINCQKPFYDATLEAFIKQEIKYQNP